MVLATLAALLTAPPAAAFAPQFDGKIWDPPNTPLGAKTKSVKGTSLQIGKLKPPLDPVPPAWTPSAPPPVLSGTATVHVGTGPAGARTALAATGETPPASSGSQLAPAGDLPVALGATAGTAGGTHSVRVDVSGASAAKAVGTQTPLVSLTDTATNPEDTAGNVKVSLDVASMGGQTWADRARLVALPACALTTPNAEECRKQTLIPSIVDPTTGKLTADVQLPTSKTTSTAASNSSRGSTSGSVRQAAAVQASSAIAAPVVLAAAPSVSGASGNYGATSLNPSMSWAAGSYLGNFTYSYPIQVPAAPGSLSPSVSLNYDSSAVDGKTSAQNSQSSWIGDGWDYQPGFIERSYKSCSKDGINNSGDLCWGGQNATLSLGGHSGTLVRDDTSGVWHLQGDDGSKVEQLTGAPNGLPTGEYWRVTTDDGTQYYFGQNHLPGGDGTDPAANSAWSVPVYSPNNGDPCYNSAAGQRSSCTMGWRWNLDYVVDVHQNLVSYTYATEANHYAQGGGQNNGNGTNAAYIRGGYLQQIAYGQRLPEQVAAKGALKAADLVTFPTAERCIPSGTITCTDAQRTTANQSYWPDVPLDQACDGSSACTNITPSFFSTKRLTTITTQVLNGSTYSPVDSWALSQSLRDPGDGTPKALWLDSVIRTGSTGGTAVSLPAVTFTPVEKPNRVDGPGIGEPTFNRPRIQQITTETGGQINVIYTTSTDQNHPSCSHSAGTMPTSEDSNTLACIPVKWYLPGSSSTTPVSDWFNKYLVTAVTEQDAVTGSLIKSTNYTYNGDAAWHRNDSEFTDPATRTWDEFRGYQSVTTTTGGAYPGEAPKTQVTTTYLRGMDGDYKLDGSQRSVSVTSPLGTTVTDSNWLAGTTLATQTYSQAGGQVQAMTGTTTSSEQTTATHAQSGGMPPLIARYPATQATTLTKTLLSSGNWRTATTVTTSDPAHGNRIVQSDAQGDGTPSAPEVCTTSSYATSSNPMLLTNLQSESKAVVGPCGTAATAANTVSDQRTLYDNQPFGQAGALGEPTSTQALDHYDSNGNPVYLSTGSSTHDVYGRTQTASTTDGSTYDQAGNRLSGPSTTAATTTTTYTPAAGAVPTSIQTTGPTGWTTTVTQDPGRTLPLTATDPNGRVTTEQYDGLGRLTAVWNPDRATNLSASIAYTYSVNGTTAPSVVTTRTLRETLPGSTNFSWRTDLYDGLGRLRQSQTTLPTGGPGRLITDTAYDSHGWPIKTSSPYYDNTTLPNGTIFTAQDSQIPAQTWTTYDGMGRVTSSSFMSYAQPQWSTTTAYPGAERTDVTPPQGGTPTTTITDARGHTSALWQYRTPTATGNATDADVTTYTYTPAGQPATRTDPAGNTWTDTYDLHGRLTSATDPDTGTSQTFYDVNSRIDHTIDARGKTLAYSYDLLGRKTGLYSGSVAPANQLAAWTYDTLAKGQTTSSTRYVGGANGQAYTQAVTGYDTAYRPLGTSVTIPSAEGALAGTYTSTNTYNPVLGTLATTSRPALGGLPAETVGFKYTYTGSLIYEAGNDYLVDRVLYDAFGRPTRTTIGALTAQVVSTQQYDESTGQIINSWIDRQTATVTTDQTSYTYNPAGSITSVSDNQNAAATDTQCFTYDYLGRLTNAWTDTQGTQTKPTGTWTDTSGASQGTGTAVSVPGIGACNNTNGPTVNGNSTSVGGPAPYWQSYTYDASGNRKGLTQHDTSGNTAKDVTTTQAFGAAQSLNTPTNAPNTGGGTGGPHALLSSTTTSPSGTTAASYQYDQLGNTTAVTGTSGTTSLTWDGEDHLASVTSTGQSAGTSYLYDADGNQLIRRDPGKTTLNLGTDELSLNTTNGSLSDVRYYPAPGGLTITRVTATTAGGTLVYQAADPHGTNGVQITSDSSQTVTRRPTDPFGNPRGAQPAPNTWAGDKGFVGGTQDPNTGLTNLGAREYDPVHGRFLNPDPILDPADPQQWNGYAYSSNDPINQTDPTGTRSSCGSADDPCTTDQSAPSSVRGGFGEPTPADQAPYHAPDTPAATTPDNGAGKGGNDGDASSPSVEDQTMAAFVSAAHKYNSAQPTVRQHASNKEIGHILNDVVHGADTRADWAAFQMWLYGASEEQVDYFEKHLPEFLDCGTAAGLDNPLGDMCDSPFGLSPGEVLAEASGGLAGVRGGSDLGAESKAASADGRVKLLPADEIGESEQARAASECLYGANSFAGETPVLLSDGSSIPIAEVKVGDTVEATDPQTGKTTAKSVTAVIVTRDDQDFTDITIGPETAPESGASGAPSQSTVTTTHHHPFWDVTLAKWTDAGDIHVGDHLREPGAGTVLVRGVRNYQHHEVTYNLTVADIHTYYVLAGTTPVLVHNTPPGTCSITTPADAPTINSKTVFTAKDRSFRIDIENQNPGQPGAGIHLQFMGRGADPSKYYFDPANGNWVTEDGSILSSRIAKQVPQSAINKAYQYFGMVAP